MKKLMKRLLQPGMTGEAVVALLIAWLIGVLAVVSQAVEASTGLSTMEQIYQAIVLMVD